MCKGHTYRVDSPLSDPVPYIDAEGAEREKDTIVNLSPHPDSSWPRHFFDDPTYRNVLKARTEEYIESGGK